MQILVLANLDVHEGLPLFDGHILLLIKYLLEILHMICQCSLLGWILVDRLAEEHRILGEVLLSD